QKDIDRPGGAATFVDGPNNERLAAAAGPTGKDLWEAGSEFTVLGLVVCSGIRLEAERFAHILLRAFEAHGQEHELRGRECVWLGNLSELPLSVDFVPFALYRANPGHIAGIVADNLFAHHAERARVGAELGRNFLMAIIRGINPRPLWPRIIGGSLF